MTKKIYQKVVICLLIGGTMLILAFNVFAENCPDKTTVNGQTITFVGGLADMGGDSQASVWFEYGESSGNYTQKTEEKILTQTGKYCITVSNLKPCTTYYYRAAMRNKAGPSYGAEQSRTTLCSTSTSTPKKVLGAATAAPTGLTNNFLVDSFFLPVVSLLILVWLFKSHLIKWEEWLDEKKRGLRNFKSQTFLKMKTAQIKAREKNKI
jgi:hypothetical protein